MDLSMSALSQRQWQVTALALMVLFTFCFFGEGRGQIRETNVRLGPVSQRCVSQSQVSCTGWGQGSVSGWISPAVVNSIPGTEAEKGCLCKHKRRAAWFFLWGWVGLERLDSEAESGKGRLYWDEPIGLVAVWGEVGTGWRNSRYLAGNLLNNFRPEMPRV